MRCDDVRESLSALLDGETTTAGEAQVHAHVEGCSACRDWVAGAQRLTQTLRARSVLVPDLTVQILAAVLADRPRPRDRRLAAAARQRIGAASAYLNLHLRSGLRWLLGGSAVIQLMLAVPDLLGAVGHEAHAGREVAAFDIALAVGLLVVACYPEHARVFAPVALTLVLCFATASALDLLQRVVTPGQVAIHTTAVIQAGLVWLLARTAASRPATA